MPSIHLYIWVKNWQFFAKYWQFFASFYQFFGESPAGFISTIQTKKENHQANILISHLIFMDFLIRINL